MGQSISRDAKTLDDWEDILAAEPEFYVPIRLTIRIVSVSNLEIIFIDAFLPAIMTTEVCMPIAAT